MDKVDTHLDNHAFSIKLSEVEKIEADIGGSVSVKRRRNCY